MQLWTYYEWDALFSRNNITQVDISLKSIDQSINVILSTCDIISASTY